MTSLDRCAVNLNKADELVISQIQDKIAGIAAFMLIGKNPNPATEEDIKNLEKQILLIEEKVPGKTCKIQDGKNL